MIPPGFWLIDVFATAPKSGRGAESPATGQVLLRAGTKRLPTCKLRGKKATILRCYPFSTNLLDRIRCVAI